MAKKAHNKIFHLFIEMRLLMPEQQTLPSYGFFTNAAAKAYKETFSWFMKQWILTPQECKVDLAQVDVAGTIVDSNSLAPLVSLEAVFLKHLKIKLSHAQITEPMGQKKRKHIEVLLQQLKASNLLPKEVQITEAYIDFLHEEFTKELHACVAQYSEPTPYSDVGLHYLRALGIPIAITTGYSRSTLDLIPCILPEDFAAISCANDLLPNGKRINTRYEMIQRNMEKLNKKEMHRSIFITDAIADVLNVREAARKGNYPCPWIICVADYSTHVDKTPSKDQSLAEKRLKVTEAFYAAGAHIVIRDFSGILPAILGVTEALKDKKRPEITDKLPIKYPEFMEQSVASCRL